MIISLLSSERYSRSFLYFPCPSPQISSFCKEHKFSLVESVFLQPRSGHTLLHPYLFLYSTSIFDFLAVSLHLFLISLPFITERLLAFSCWERQSSMGLLHSYTSYQVMPRMQGPDHCLSVLFLRAGFVVSSLEG